MTSIFAKDRIGHDVRCRISKDGREVSSFVRWTHAIKGQETSYSELVVTPFEKPGRVVTSATETVKTRGWTVLEVDVAA